MPFTEYRGVQLADNPTAQGGTNLNDNFESLADRQPFATASKAGAYSATAGDLVVCNATLGGFAVTLPSSPSTGDRVGVVLTATSGSNRVTIDGNGKAIEGVPARELATAGEYLELVYNGVVWSMTSGGTGVEACESDNVVLNGCGAVGQEQTSVTGASNGNYVLDGWKYLASGITGVIDVAQNTDVPTASEAGYRIPTSIRLEVTTAQASIGATNYSALAQPIEGYTWNACAQRTCCLRFWVKSSKTGKFYATLRNGGLDREVPLPFEIDTANTWERKTLVVPASPSGGTWNYANGTGVELLFVLASGSDFSGGTDKVWGDDDALTGGSTSNLFDTTNTIYVTDLRLVAGAAVPNTSPRSFPDELQLAQRYYCKSYEYATTPGTATGTGSVRGTAMANTTTNTANGGTCGIPFPAEMRTSPTLTIYSPSAGSSGNLDYARAGTAAATVAATASASTKRIVNVYTTAASGLTAGNAVEQFYHFVADARM